ncbi:hypothetical protein CGRA01v4_07609 [Colletotrichum graminicola]|nr:hypothetical protein CGRA01v4_07609 [Colletotrichum graminicola]
MLLLPRFRSSSPSPLTHTPLFLQNPLSIRSHQLLFSRSTYRLPHFAVSRPGSTTRPILTAFTQAHRPVCCSSKPR